MNRSEKIMLSHRQWLRGSEEEWLKCMRWDRDQYNYDEAPYYVDSYNPQVSCSRMVQYTWSLAHALRLAYQERKCGRKAVIINNQTDETVLHTRMAKWALSMA